MNDHVTSNAAPDDAWLLVSDVDDTLVGDDAGLDELIERLERSDRLVVAANSSRPHESVMRTMAELPRGFTPRAVITALGTELYFDGSMIDAWQRRFEGFDRRPIDALAKELGLEPHGEEMQTPWKASYTLTGDPPLAEVLKRLEGLGLPLRTIVSHNDADLDVIPERAGKGAATMELAQRLGVPVERVVVAGDSANDVLMFDAVDKAIAVGNARAELRRVADPSRTFFADRPCAGGIVEGLDHYGAPLVRPTVDREIPMTRE